MLCLHLIVFLLGIVRFLNFVMLHLHSQKVILLVLNSKFITKEKKKRCVNVFSKFKYWPWQSVSFFLINIHTVHIYVYSLELRDMKPYVIRFLNVTFSKRQLKNRQKHSLKATCPTLDPTEGKRSTFSNISLCPVVQQDARNGKFALNISSMGHNGI